MYSAIGIFSQRSCAVYAAEWSAALSCVIFSCVTSFCAIFVRKYTQSFRNGSKSRKSVPLWQPHVAVTFAVAFLSGIVLRVPFRNGSKSRKSVPLWQPHVAVTFAVAFLSGIVLRVPFHNGSKSRNSVSLWKSGRRSIRQKIIGT